MININVRKTSKEQEEVLINAATFYLDKLNVRKRTIPLDIEITLCKLDADGYCDFNYDHKYPEIAIHLNKRLSQKDMLVALAHELVHSRQYLRKELISKDRVFLWKGKTSKSYEWEDEAYDLESQLYERYENECKYKHWHKF
jgi:hypothetical protein